MIKLDKIHFIAQGTNRACYIHPEDSTKCIKVTISNDHSESKKELAYYKYLQKRNISWKHIAKYYSTVHTSLGNGDVFDLIKDFDGSISKFLLYYLREEEDTKSVKNPLLLLEELRRYTLENGIFVKDLNTKNILLQRLENNEYKLVLIDGVLNRDFLYYSNFIKLL